MKKTILLILILILSTNCEGQNKTVTLDLQQIDFKDDRLTKLLFNITNSELSCFDKNVFYVLDFFQSSLSTGEYYLSIDEFVANDKSPNTIVYYTIINNITFFISNKVDGAIFDVLTTKRGFDLYIEEIPYSVGADYHFLIWKTISGDYFTILSTCGE